MIFNYGILGSELIDFMLAHEHLQYCEAVLQHNQPHHNKQRMEVSIKGDVPHKT